MIFFFIFGCALFFSGASRDKSRISPLGALDTIASMCLLHWCIRITVLLNILEFLSARHKEWFGDPKICLFFSLNSVRTSENLKFCCWFCWVFLFVCGWVLCFFFFLSFCFFCVCVFMVGSFCLHPL